MAGTTVQVRGIKRYRHKITGLWYCYHRATGKRIIEEFGSGAFFERLRALDAEAAGIAEDKAKPGTLKALILSYRATDDFRDLAPRTKADYERVIAFLKPLYSQPIAAFTTPALVALRDEWRRSGRGRRFCNYVRTVLVLLFKRAIELGLMRENPAAAVGKVKRDKKAKPLNRKWMEAERHAVWNACPPHLKLPFAIGLTSGMREGDVLALRRDVIKDGLISIRTAKRDVPIWIPISREIREALIGQAPHDAITLCATSRGTPWTNDGFRSSFFKLIKRLEADGKVKPGLTFHGLRHTAAAVMAENSASAEDIAAVLGQKDSGMARHYAGEADRSRRSRATITKLTPLGRRSKKDKS
jgi:integrase